MPWLRFLLVVTCFLICSMRAQAAPAPIVFDFEDGLQGWTLGGSAQRVQTQVLGGEWAIFLDGFLGAVISFIPENLQAIGSVTVEQLIIDGSGSIPVSQGSCLINTTFTDCISIGFIQRVIGMDPPEAAVVFIDNITFHPVPEPSSWLLLSLGIAGLVMTRRKLASRAYS